MTTERESDRTRKRQRRQRRQRRQHRQEVQQVVSAGRPNRPLTYLGWPILSFAATFILLQVLGAHVALFGLGVSFVVFMVLVSWGELQPWAARRGIGRPRAFGISVGVLADVLWVSYVVGVSLPLAFNTGITETSGGQNMLFWITFLPVVPAFGLSWLSLYTLAKRGLLFRRPSG